MASDSRAVRIRPATTEDAAGLMEVVSSVGWFDEMLPDDPAQRVRVIAGNLVRLAESPVHDILVAELQDDGIAGYLNMHRQPCLTFATPEGFISELFIRDDCRGKGIGGRLLEEAERLARERGWWRLHLVNHRERDSYRRGFYESRGWEERPDMADFVLRLHT
jgi:GNAT superfamily N-acetyltransferase